VRQKFTGYERDSETGLDFAQARYHASIQGRFTSVDPLMASAVANLPQSWNRYSYCLNNPLNCIDPSGMIWGILDGNISWYKTKEEMENARATEWTQRIYQAGNGQWIRLDENGPNANADLSQPWGINERRGWSEIPGPPMELDMDSQLAVGGIFNAARVGLMSLAETFLSSFGRKGATEVAEEGSTSLFRAVMDKELDDLAEGAFRNPAGIEVKYFSETAEGAASYARQAHRAFGDGPFTIVETRIPSNLITSGMRVTVDRGIRTIVVPTEALPQLIRPTIWNYTPLPK
jgi:RHS repeat-associated protein